ncbi:MAG: phosphate ABC transporter, permease protein PstA [Deltaproteobacteria bacterium RIFCSPHIGHO2_02_FULL_40_11]|nr:MAG: phosphate ABC transporter, permease protein PstA [Deltaproteobacteria bacterium RIFCSPHIGHO2_02_FULL_40_11]
MRHRFLKENTIENAFKAICFLSILLPLVLIVVLIGDAVIDGWSRLSLDFLTGFPSRKPELAGFLPALVGSFYLMLLTSAIAIPLGLGAAIYLEEYAKPGFLTSLIEINISNLAGVPSIIYGLLGLELFVRMSHMGRSLLAGACTLALLLLPMVIMVSRESLRVVPNSLREAGFALGADQWQTIWKIILPMSIPGALTGIILSVARAIGETAPLITIGALTYVAFLPDSIHSAFTAMPIQIFNWISRPQTAFQTNAAAGIVVLLFLMLFFNALAIWLRARLQRKVYW